MSTPLLRAWGAGATLLLLAGCGENTAPPAAGALHVVLASTGAVAESDRYRVRLDGGSDADLDTGGAFFSPVASGVHVVTLDEYPARCRVDDGQVRDVVITAGDTASARFDVTCANEFGGLVIRLAVSGEDQDPSGYTVVLDGQPQASGVFGGSIAFRVGAGTHTVEVTDQTASCPVEGATVRAVQVPPGGSVTVDFQITCTVSPPAGRGQEIVFETERAGLGPRGSHIIQLYSINADGTGLRLLSASPGGEQRAASWSSDGSRLLFNNLSPANDPFLFIMNADGSAVAPYLDVDGRAAWSPDMSRLALSILDPDVDDFEAYGLGTVPFENATPNDIDYFTFASHLSRPSWSPDGTRLVYVRSTFDDEGGSRDMEILDPSTGASDTLPINLEDLEDPTWSPDGQWLLFSGSADFGPQDLYLVRPDGIDPPIQLTDTPDDEITPAWSPDGRRIAFATNRDGNYEIYVMDADGTHPLRLTNDPGRDDTPAWRP